jgi:hypothetical protein
MEASRAPTLSRKQSMKDTLVGRFVSAASKNNLVSSSPALLSRRPPPPPRATQD